MTDSIKKRAPGAGRKKGEETKLMRVPVGAEDAIKGIIELYKYYGSDDFSFAVERSVSLSEKLGCSSTVLSAFQLTHPESFGHGRHLKQDFRQAFGNAGELLRYLGCDYSSFG